MTKSQAWTFRLAGANLTVRGASPITSQLWVSVGGRPQPQERKQDNASEELETALHRSFSTIDVQFLGTIIII